MEVLGRIGPSRFQSGWKIMVKRTTKQKNNLRKRARVRQELRKQRKKG